MSQLEIAIVGMAGCFPNAPSLDQLWSMILEGKSGLAQVPAHRWPPNYFDPQSSHPARFYANRGGFIDEARFEALRFKVMPRAARGAEPDQLMALQICAEALEDAGYAALKGEEGSRGRAFDRSKVQVILGRGGYIGPGMNSLNQRVRTVEQIIELARTRRWEDEESLARLAERLVQEHRPFGPDSAIGLVPNLCASRVADRLGLGGAAYTLDAACASSLLAVDQGCTALRLGRADMALVGGVHLVHDLTFWSVFSQLGALSRSGEIRPFDKGADGLLIGEGVGSVLLKRLEDALEDGDRIYAVIHGVGVSSDGQAGSLMNPDSHGQRTALEAAWEGLDRAQIGLIEAHGTGTPTGDAVELRSTLDFLGERGGAVGLGSIKSNIGHAMPAAGIAGMIKASLAIYHGIKPPTLNVSQPHPALEGSRLQLLTDAQAWDDEQRLAGVSAFGFGGINAHVALGQSPTYSPLRPKPARLSERSVLWCIAGRTQEELASRLLAYASGDDPPINRLLQSGEGAYRVALLDPTIQDLLNASELVRSGKNRSGRHGLWINSTGEGFANESSLTTSAEKGISSADKIVLMFPGVEALFSPRVDDLSIRHGLSAPTLFPPERIEERGVSVLRLGLLLKKCFDHFGISARHILGHSVGEWTGLIASGFLKEEEIEPFIAGLDPEGLHIPEVAFIAVGASQARVEPLLSTLSDFDQIAFSHDNCPHQCVLCVPLEMSSRVIDTLTGAQIIAQELPFRSGFHAPCFAPYANELTQYLNQLTLAQPQATLWSATLVAPYPTEAEELFELCGRHLVETVRFRELTERLYDEGVRIFIQLGTGSLGSFVSDTLRGKPHRVLEAHSDRHSGWSQWLNLAASLFAEGFDLELAHLKPRGERRADAMLLNLGPDPLLVRETSPSPKPLATKERSVTPLEDREDHAKLDLPISQRVTSQQEIAREFMGRVEPSSLWGERPSDVGTQLGEATSPSPLVSSVDPQTSEQVWSATWKLDLENHPYLFDHCFFRQPDDWLELSDRFPVVPMTLSIQWVMEVAQQIADERSLGRVIGVREVRAAKWIEVDPAEELEVQARLSSSGVVKVELIGHLTALIELSLSPPVAPSITWGPAPLEEPCPISAQQIYQDRWMFHGRAYQGIVEVSGLSPQGIRGLIRHEGTPGALLDNVGQLFGFWVMLTQREDRVVMPVRLERLKLYGPPPPRGAIIRCAVQITSVQKREVSANMALWIGDRVWATLEGWRDWRFETSGSLWALMRYPERQLYCQPLYSHQEWALSLATGVSGAASSREFLVGRCLNHRERQEYRALNLKRQRDWLAGRIAAKDAARAMIWSRDPRPIFPVELELVASREGVAPCFEKSGSRGLRGAELSLSLAHCSGIAVGAASSSGRSIGIDIERVEARDESWCQSAFSSRDLECLAGAPPDQELLTAMWTAKEAVAKRVKETAQGAGLGSPKRWSIIKWSSGGAIHLEGIEIKQSGTALVNTPDGDEVKVYWWIFISDSKLWALSVSVE